MKPPSPDVRGHSGAGGGFPNPPGPTGGCPPRARRHRRGAGPGPEWLWLGGRPSHRISVGPTPWLGEGPCAAQGFKELVIHRGGCAEPQPYGHCRVLAPPGTVEEEEEVWVRDVFPLEVLKGRRGPCSACGMFSFLKLWLLRGCGSPTCGFAVGVLCSRAREGWPTCPSASQPLRASRENRPNLGNSSATASSSSSAAAVPSALHLPGQVGSQSH